MPESSDVRGWVPGGVPEVIRVSGIAIPKPVSRALLERMSLHEFTSADLAPLALAALRETGGPASLCHVVVERIISREARAGRIAKGDRRGPRGCGVWRWVEPDADVAGRGALAGAVR